MRESMTNIGQPIHSCARVSDWPISIHNWVYIFPSVEFSIYVLTFTSIYDMQRNFWYTYSMDVFLYQRVVEYRKKGQITAQEFSETVVVKGIFWSDEVISQFANISKIEFVMHQMKAHS